MTYNRSSLSEGVLLTLRKKEKTKRLVKAKK
jgi:hypothetical protein